VSRELPSALVLMTQSLVLLHGVVVDIIAICYPLDLELQ